jgi:hypothetical protein
VPYPPPLPSSYLNINNLVDVSRRQRKQKKRAGPDDNTLKQAAVNHGVGLGSLDYDKKSSGPLKRGTSEAKKAACCWQERLSKRA